MDLNVNKKQEQAANAAANASKNVDKACDKVSDMAEKAEKTCHKNHMAEKASELKDKASDVAHYLHKQASGLGEKMKGYAADALESGAEKAKKWADKLND